MGEQEEDNVKTVVERVGTGIEYPGCSLMVDLWRVNNNNNNSNTGVNK